MKKFLKYKRYATIFLAFLVAIGGFTSSQTKVHAVSNAPSEATANTAEHSIATGTLEVKNDISKDEAAKIAILFIANTLNSNPECKWNRDTKISTITTLYGDSENVSGYAIQLTKKGQDNGYIVVSATGDLNLIQEYGYEGKPLFYAINSGDFDKVYYTAPLAYAVKKNNTLYGLDSSSKKTVTLILDQLQEKFKHNPNKLQKNRDILEKVRNVGFDLNMFMGTSGQNGTDSGYGNIYDSYAYVNNKYGSGWTSSYWGTIASLVTPHLLTEWSDNNNCTLVAMTTIFEYFRNQNIMSGIPATNTINSDVKSIATSYGYTPESGTNPWYISDIATDLLKKYGNTTGSSNSVYVWTFSTVTDDIDAKRPLISNINSGYYADHSVTVVGYSDFSRYWYDDDKEFLKVYDGWTKDGRYIDWDLFCDSTLASFTHIKP